MARAVYWLSPPTRLTFMVSVILVILALLVRYAHVSIPVVSAHVSSRCRSATWFCWWADFDCAATTQCTHAPKAVLSEPVK